MKICFRRRLTMKLVLTDSACDNKDSENSNNCNDKGKNLKTKCLELRKGNVNKSKNSKLT